MWHTFQPIFSPLCQAIIVIGNPKHHLSGLFIVHLLGQNPRLFGALVPMRGIVDVGCGHQGSLRAA